MFKKLKSLKDLLWAVGIGLALTALFIGLVAASFTSYRGDRTRPVMDLNAGRAKKAESAEASETPAPETGALRADGTLHPLRRTDDAGEDYLAGLTILCDGSFSGLRGSGLSEITVWSSETGSLPMNEAEDWKIRFPRDGSITSPYSSVMISKPKIVVLAVGNDASAAMDESAFKEKYRSVIRGLCQNLPELKIVCLGPCGVTASYAGDDGMTSEKAAEIGRWIQQICVDTGAYYGELGDSLWQDGCLKDAYADGSGRALNTEGLRALLGYLREHSVDGQ